MPKRLKEARNPAAEEIPQGGQQKPRLKFSIRAGVGKVLLEKV